MQSLLKALTQPQKNGAIHTVTIQFQHLMIVAQLGYVKYTFGLFIGVFSI